MSEDEQSLIPRLQRAYRQLRKSRLAKTTDPRQTDNEALEHFVSVLNSALPRPGDAAEEAVDRVIKLQYFSNPRGFIRGLHHKNTGKNSRKDTRFLILLTIGLEIVREFELEKIVHLHWNNESREYEIDLNINIHQSPTRNTKSTEQGQEQVEHLQETVRRLEAKMARLTSGGNSSPEPEKEEEENDDFQETKTKTWADMVIAGDKKK